MNGEHRARARPSSGRDGRFAWLALLILPAILCVASFLTGCGAGPPNTDTTDASAGAEAGADTGAATAGALPANAWEGTDPRGRPPVGHHVWTDRYDHLFRKYSKRFFGPGFDWRWFKAQGIAESGLREDAESWVGAKGIMQIMPATLREIAEKSDLAVLDNDDPGANIAAGIFYDRSLYERWNDIPRQRERLAFTFASYNGGRSRILRAREACGGGCELWAQVTGHAPEETRGYVARILTLMGHEAP